MGLKVGAAALAIAAALLFSGCMASTSEPKAASDEPAGDSGDVSEAPPAASDQTEPSASAGGEPSVEPKPSEAPKPAPKPSSAPEPASNSTGDEPQTQQYEPRLDTLLEEDYAVLPVEPPGLFVSEFKVEHPYQTLEVTGAYGTASGVWLYAVDLTVVVKDPDGNEVIHFNTLDAFAVAEGIGGSSQSFPIGYVYDVPLGTYTISVTGEGATLMTHIIARGHLGVPFDFKFHNSLNKESDLVKNYRGKVLLVDLMATWCGPCRNAMPGLKEIRDDYKGKVDILSVDVDTGESDDLILGMRSEFGAEWTFGRDDYGTASDAFGTGWIPSFAILDQYGGLLYRHIGEMAPEDIRAIIDYSLEHRA